MVAPSAPPAPVIQMVEYKSTRDVETFSKFLENGGTLPEEPPVSEVRGQPPLPRAVPSPCWVRGWILQDGDRDRVRQRSCVHPCLTAAFSR